MRQTILATITLVGLILASGISHAADKQAEPMPPPPNPEGLFKRIDADGDGKISKEEFSGFFEKVSQGAALISEVVAGQFDKLDANKDRTIDKDEFKKLPSVLLPEQLKPEELMKKFRTPDGGIRIDIEEIKKMVDELRRKRAEKQPK